LVAALCVGTCLSFLGFTAQPFLRSRDRAGVILTVTAAAAVTDIGLVLMTVGRFGAAGAAVAYLATAAVLTIGLLGYEAGAHGSRSRGLVRYLGPWIVGSSVGLGMSALLGDSAWWVGATAGAVGAATAYIALVRILRLGMTRGDLDAVTGALPRLLARPLGSLGRLAVTHP
jgi:O-antigen/teichoic acid export membrane protein